MAGDAKLTDALIREIRVNGERCRCCGLKPTMERVAERYDISIVTLWKFSGARLGFT
jgi:hypothetical protein